ncbi:Sua5 family C-terminal domain-containing protein [Acidithiobacillus sp.]|uniref:Sua5 family C-terminal domain-containing protein n=1 Tax=Acidithiobacillus sp. TaxID=1872118 RepID=UPI003CFD1E44
MTIYLTDKTSISEVRRVNESGFVQAFERNKVVGVLSITSLPLPENCFYKILPMSPEFSARQLYTILRELDSNNLDCILVESPPHTPGWAAVHDRLTRAGSSACMTHISL